MGLSNESKVGKTFLNIVAGKFAQRVPEGTNGAVSRKNKKDALVWEMLYDSLSGQITSMKIEKDDYGKHMAVDVKSGIDTFQVQIPVDSKYFDTFCYKINNVDLSKDVKITPYSFEPSDGSGKKTGMNLYQDGNKIDHYYTKEDPKDKPVPPMYVNGQRVDDDEWKIFKLSERKWLMNMISNKALAMANDHVKTSAPTQATGFYGDAKPMKPQPKQQSAQAESDLPF